MNANSVHIGDTVQVTSGWFSGTQQGQVIFKKEKRALVYGDDGSLGSYKYSKMTLIERANGNEVLEAAREFVEKIKIFL